jgi:tetrahydromethanopterin S-methyltransferase subunit G
MDDASAGPAPAPSGTASQAPSGLLASAEWPARLADTVEEVVTTVHDRAVRPLLLVARGLVYGIVVGAMALVLAVLLSVALIRLLDVYAFSHRVWASYLVVGGAFSLLGLVALSLGRPRRRQED